MPSVPSAIRATWTGVMDAHAHWSASTHVVTSPVMSIRSRAAAAMAALCVASCSAAPTAQLERAVLTLPTRTASASLFFTLRNTGALPLTVVQVAVDGADESSLETTAAHRMPGTAATADPMVMFMPVESLTVAAGATQRFAPGGYVVLAKRMSPAPVAGDTVWYTVRFSSGATLRGAARAVPYAALDSALGDRTTSVSPDTMVPTVATGRDTYMSNGCASCHGVNGHGDGPIAATLMPPPRDFRSTAPFRNGSTVADIAQTLATGIPRGGQMPLFAHLTDAERRALALYVLSLRRTHSEDTTP